METINATPTSEPVNPNAEIASAFDALARFFYDHPEVKVPYKPDIHVFMETADEMSAFVSSNPDFIVSADSVWFNAKKAFGSIDLIYCIQSSKVGEFQGREVEVVTTQQVWVPSSPEFAVKEQ